MAITDNLYGQQPDLSALVTPPAMPTISRQDAVAGFMDGMGQVAPAPAPGLQPVFSPPPPVSRNLEGGNTNRTRSVF